MEYYIGQIFEEEYPVEAAEWVNNNDAMIVEIESHGDIRRFQIQEVPAPTEDEIKKRRVEQLKEELNTTDYKIIKCSEYQLAGIELPYDIATLHAQRQAIRDEINELEN